MNKVKLSTITVTSLALASFSAFSDSPNEWGRWGDNLPPTNGGGPDVPGDPGNTPSLPQGGQEQGNTLQENLLAGFVDDFDDDDSSDFTDAAPGDWVGYVAYGTNSNDRITGDLALELRPADTGTVDNGTLSVSISDYGDTAASGGFSDSAADFSGAPSPDSFSGAGINTTNGGAASITGFGESGDDYASGSWGYSDSDSPLYTFGGNGSFIAGQPTQLADMETLSQDSIIGTYRGNAGNSFSTVEIVVDFDRAAWDGSFTEGWRDVSSFNANGDVAGFQFDGEITGGTTRGEGAVLGGEVLGTFVQDNAAKVIGRYTVDYNLEGPDLSMQDIFEATRDLDP